MFQSISQAGTCSPHLAVGAFVPAAGGLSPSSPGLSMDPHCTARPGSFQAKPQAHLWTKLIQKWHLSICSLLISLPSWAPVGGKASALKIRWAAKGTAQMQRPLPWTWLAPAPQRTSQHYFLGLQVKWEKLISWFDVCALSTRHSLDQAHSVLCFDHHFHTSSCVTRSLTHEFPQLQWRELINPRKNNFHAEYVRHARFRGGLQLVASQRCAIQWAGLLPLRQ